MYLENVDNQTDLVPIEWTKTKRFL